MVHSLDLSKIREEINLFFSLISLPRKDTRKARYLLLEVKLNKKTN